jgi:hypothetical protein
MKTDSESCKGYLIEVVQPHAGVWGKQTSIPKVLKRRR